MVDETKADAGTGVNTSEEFLSVTSQEVKEKLVQTSEIRDVGPCRKHVKVIVDRVSVDKQMNEEFSKLRMEIPVAGFRLGKTPRKFIERRYYKEVADQVKGKLLVASLEQLSSEIDLAPLSTPDINPLKLEIPREGPFVYEFEVEVRPDFTLPEYKGLKLNRYAKKFSDADIECGSRKLLADLGQIVPKTSGNVALGDFIVADVVTQNGNRDLSHHKEQVIRVDQQLAFLDGFVPDFGKKLVGAKVGDRCTIDVHVSSTGADETLRGKSVKAVFSIKEVKTTRLPELTEDFLSEQFGVRTKTQFEEKVRVGLEHRVDYLDRILLRRQVVEQLGGDLQKDLPGELIQAQSYKALVRRVLEMRCLGLSQEELVVRERHLERDMVGTTVQALLEHFLLQKIAEQEKIDVTEADIDQAVEGLAGRENESARRTRARLEKEDQMDSLAAEVIESRTLQFLVDHAEMTEIPLAKDETADTALLDVQIIPGDLNKPVPPPKNTSPA